jgi:hypothetical protein
VAIHEFHARGRAEPQIQLDARPVAGAQVDPQAAGIRQRPTLAGFVNSFPIGIVSPYLAYPGWGGKIDSDGVPLIQQAILGKIPAKDCLDRFAEILKKEMS